MNGVALFLSAFVLGWIFGLTLYHIGESKARKRGRKLRETLATGDPEKLKRFTEEEK